MSISDATILSKLPGFLKPDDEIRQSWFFTLMGRTTAAVLLVFGYLAALGLIWRSFGQELLTLHAEQPWIFWGAIGAPLVLVFMFSVLPTIRRALRERRLHPLAEREGEVRQGYYRLRPYEEADAAAYTRPDNAVADALAWLTATEETVLYLSGASGSGKTSLINAGVIPKLRETGWRLLTVRGMGDPLGALKEALLTEADLFEQPPSRRSNVLKLLQTLAKARAEAEAPPLLIVLDQFEEYLILPSETEREAYADLLRALAEQPLPGLRLLHVFRGDYRELLFKYDFPDYTLRRTGFEVAPFNRREAERFLRGGLQVLEERGYDALFAGLDRIEDAPGLYRPITLNMVGHVLGQQGRTLADEPGRLIERYLKDVIARGSAKDFAPAVLHTMITREGTKQVRALEVIAEAARIEPWQAKATLANLEAAQLVRPLPQGAWEISHDFLARQISQLLGRLRFGALTRVATPALAIALVGWTAAVAIAIPAWNETRVRAALDAIATLPMSRSPDAEDGLAFKAGSLLGDQDLKQFTEYVELLPTPLTSLDLSGTFRITDLSPLQGLPLTSLDLSDAAGITDLSPLQGLPLTWLRLSSADGLTDLSPLKGLPLTWLDLSGAAGITDLSPLKGMPLTWLDLSGAAGITDLSPLKSMSLTTLDLNENAGFFDQRRFEGKSLTTLHLSGTAGSTDLSPLKGISRLRIDGASDALLKTLE